MDAMYDQCGSIRFNSANSTSLPHFHHNVPASAALTNFAMHDAASIVLPVLLLIHTWLQAIDRGVSH
jgi:hypothetical protein